MKKIFLFTLSLLSLPTNAIEQISGRVIAITSPNKIIMLANGTKKIEVRLYGTRRIIMTDQPPLLPSLTEDASTTQVFENKFSNSSRYKNVYDKKSIKSHAEYDPNAKALFYLKDMALGKYVTCEMVTTSPIQCDLYVNDHWINAEMVLNGLLAAESNAETPELKLMMESARKQRKGIWWDVD